MWKVALWFPNVTAEGPALDIDRVVEALDRHEGHMHDRSAASGPTWENVAVELTDGVSLDDVQLTELCNRRGIRRLALFGSALRGELGPESDIDLLVEFQPGRVPGLLGIATIELELQEMLGRPVDLRTPGDLSRYFRATVLNEARLVYDAA